jgi:hypothetical protein
MNKKISWVAWGVFTLAWGLSLTGKGDVTSIICVGLMWLSLAAAVGEKK